MNEIDGDLRIPDMFYPPKKMMCTEKLSLFLREYYLNIDYFFFIVGVVSLTDENRVRAAQYLYKYAETDEARQRHESSLKNKNIMFDKLKKFSYIQSRNLTIGIVNAFQRYFSEIIQSAASKNPYVISTSQTVKVEDVLRFRRHSDLVSFLIDRKINDLSYGGLSELEKYFGDRLGIEMFSDARSRDLMRLFVELRNISVHNGGVVNELFCSRVRPTEGFSFSIGKRYHVDLDELVVLSENAVRVALRIDDEISKKFKLKRKRYLLWSHNVTTEETQS